MEKTPLEKQKEQIETLRTRLHAETREARLKRMLSENRALYEAIIGRRDKIGKIEGFDIVEQLRKLRGDNDEPTRY